MMHAEAIGAPVLDFNHRYDALVYRRINQQSAVKRKLRPAAHGNSACLPQLERVQIDHKILIPRIRLSFHQKLFAKQATTVVCSTDIYNHYQQLV